MDPITPLDGVKEAVADLERRRTYSHPAEDALLAVGVLADLNRALAEVVVNLAPDTDDGADLAQQARLIQRYSGMLVEALTP